MCLSWKARCLKNLRIKKKKKRVQMSFHTEVNLIVGLNVKWRILRKKPERIQDLNGIWTSDRYDALTNWAMNPLLLEASPQLCVLVFPWWDECDVYEINYITTAEIKLERNLCNCVRSLAKSKSWLLPLSDSMHITLRNSFFGGSDSGLLTALCNEAILMLKTPPVIVLP